MQLAELTWPAVQALELVWVENDLRFVSESAEPSIHGPARLPTAVTLAVEHLLEGHAAIGARNDAKAETLFTTLTEASVPPYVVKAWRTMGRSAHKLAHVSATPVSSDDEAALQERFLAFEAGLLALVGRTFENMDHLDDILNSANS